MASEKDKKAVYEQIGQSFRRDAEGVGVTNPLDPEVETPEQVEADLVQAAKYIAKDQLGAMDDCGFSPFR